MRERPQALTTSIALRVPVFKKEDGLRYKIDELESYLLLSAFQQGELAEARLSAHDELRVARAEWRELAPAPGARLRTKDEREEAKRVVKPELAAAIDELEEEIDRLSEEFNRLEGDATKVSRAHTFITGK